MSKFVDDLDGRSKEELKSCLACTGIKHLVEWIIWQVSGSRTAASDYTDNFEEVMLQRGKVAAFKEVTHFIQEAQEQLRNYSEEDG